MAMGRPECGLRLPSLLTLFGLLRRFLLEMPKGLSPGSHADWPTRPRKYLSLTIRSE